MEELLPQGETLQFMQQLWKLVHALDVRSKRMAKDIGVTGPQRLVIRIIGQSSLPSARQLADTLELHPSTLTGVLARLERQKLIERLADPKDRRRARFRLTAAGQRIDRAKRGTVEACVRRALAVAGPTRVRHTSELIALITRVLATSDSR